MKRIDVIAVQVVRERRVSYDAERLTTPEQAVAAFTALLGEPDREYMIALMLDGKNRITSVHRISEGSLNQSIVHPRETFKAAILSNAASIILAHNHPSGDPSPSKEDMAITRRLVDAGEMLGIKVLDHVIVGTDGRFLSMTGEGLI